MQSTRPIDASSSIPNTNETKRKSHALIFVINLILLLGVIACACAPLSQSVKYITTFTGIGGILLIDVIYCAVIYGCDKNSVTSETPPLSRESLDPEFVQFLEKVGYKNNGDYPTLTLDLTEVGRNGSGLKAIMDSPQIPKNEISIIHQTKNEHHYWIYFPNVKMVVNRTKTKEGGLLVTFEYMDLDGISRGVVGFKTLDSQEIEQQKKLAKLKELLAQAMTGKSSAISMPSDPYRVPYERALPDDDEYKEFLTKAGLKNVDGKFRTLHMTFSTTSRNSNLLPEIQEKLKELNIPETGILFLRGQDANFRLYLPKTRALLTPMTSSDGFFYMEFLCETHVPKILSWCFISHFDEGPGKFKDSCDALRQLIKTTQQE